MSDPFEEWVQELRKIWSKWLRAFDEDACEQLPEEEDSIICTKASPASGYGIRYRDCHDA